VLSGGLTQEDAAIEQTETQEDTTRKRIAQIKRELQQNEQLRADGTRDAKDATQKELQLKQQLAEANGQLVDSEIQKQEQLRAAIAATFQRQHRLLTYKAS
jgi:chromosome segregation ATPase